MWNRLSCCIQVIHFRECCGSCSPGKCLGTFRSNDLQGLRVSTRSPGCDRKSRDPADPADLFVQDRAGGLRVPTEHREVRVVGICVLVLDKALKGLVGCQIQLLRLVVDSVTALRYGVLDASAPHTLPSVPCPSDVE